MDVNLHNIEKINAKLRAGEDINLRNSSGESLLHLAIRDPKCKLEDVRRLLDLGAEINVANDYGATPLHLAVVHKCSTDPNVINLLLSRGAALHAVTEDGLSPLHYSARQGWNNANVIIKLLLDRGSNIHLKCTEGRTPLHSAMNNIFIKSNSIQLLLDRGARVNEVDNSFKPPLQIELLMALTYSFRGKDTTSIKLLLENGALIGLVEDNLLRRVIMNHCRELNSISFKYVQLLMKYAFLEGIDTFSLITHLCFDDKLSAFASECASEFHKMDSEVIAVDKTLSQFLNRQPKLQPDVCTCKEDGECITNPIFKILINDKYPIYREVISAKLTIPCMIEYLNRHPIYFVSRSLHPYTSYKTVVLNYDSVYNVVQYLSHDDLLNFVLASHTNGNQGTFVSSDFYMTPNKKMKIF